MSFQPFHSDHGESPFQILSKDLNHTINLKPTHLASTKSDKPRINHRRDVTSHRHRIWVIRIFGRSRESLSTV